MAPDRIERYDSRRHLYRGRDADGERSDEVRGSSLVRSRIESYSARPQAAGSEAGLPDTERTWAVSAIPAALRHKYRGLAHVALDKGFLSTAELPSVSSRHLSGRRCQPVFS